MQHVIRSKSSGHFLTSDGSWSKDIASALAFPDTLAVIQEKQKRQLKDVELLLVVQDKPGAYDITLSLS